jgi:hypothetical protein
LAADFTGGIKAHLDRQTIARRDLSALPGCHGTAATGLNVMDLEGFQALIAQDEAGLH